MFRTEYEFVLPHGYLDENGEQHREGVMRLATAADEILPLKDPRVQKNPAYLVVIVLSRVITRLGDLDGITTKTIENLFVADLAYLQRLYNEINRVDSEAQADEIALTSSGRVPVPGGF
jgi:phage FluMu protein gp41